MNIYIHKLSGISTHNKYHTYYQRIVTFAKSRSHNRQAARELLGYVEGHHILPRSFGMGGESDPDNIVYLTAKEHILIHRLMCKFTTGEYRIKSLRAFHCMVYKDNGGQNKRNPTLHQMAKAREAVSTSNSGERGIRGVPMWFSTSDDIQIFEDTIRDHVEQNLSDPEIGAKYGVSAVSIYNWRRKLDIKNRRWQLRDREWLEHEYHVSKLSCQEIADVIGCTSAAVQQYFKKFQIKMRTATERQQNVDKAKRGFFPAKDFNGKKYFIRKDNPRYIRGELVGLAKII